MHCRDGALVELLLYSVFVDKTPRIVVHNKNKNVHTSCVICVPCGDGLLMIYVSDICLYTTNYKLTVTSVD
jgi:hypothetical protein